MSDPTFDGLTSGQIAVSLGYRAEYFRSAQGGWRDDTANLLDTAAACIAGLYKERATYRNALSGLLEMAEDLAATFPIKATDAGANVIEQARAALANLSGGSPLPQPASARGEE